MKVSPDYHFSLALFKGRHHKFYNILMYVLLYKHFTLSLFFVYYREKRNESYL